MNEADAIRALIDAYVSAYNAGDADACAAVYTGDANVMSAFGPPATGREAIAEAHRDWFSYGEQNKIMRIIDHGAQGNLAWCRVRYTADVPQADGATTQETGHSLNVLARQADGSYLIHQTCLIHHSQEE